jgi:organic radical activating enzyme
MRIINRLDIMIAYSCNISCTGCISLSDRKRDGVASIEDITRWIAKWQNYVTPEVISLFGGEPTLHPRLIEICYLVRNAWPKSTIRLITNGYLLDNFDPNIWFEFVPFEIQISLHRADHKEIIKNKIRQILECRTGWKFIKHGGVNEHKQHEWVIDNFSIYRSIFKDFVVPYRLDGNKITTWNSSPSEAHKICGSPNTPILYKGNFYKCPPVANVIDLTGDTLDYSVCDTVDKLDEFIQGIGSPESVCGMCPAKSQAVIIDHFDIKNVQLKQKTFS